MIEREGGRTTLRLGMGAVGVGWVEGKIERRWPWEVGGLVTLFTVGAGGLWGMLLSVERGWVAFCSLLEVVSSCFVETWASRVVILGSGVSGSEETGLDRFSLLCICRELCQDADPDGLIFSGRVKGCDVLRLTGSL